MGMTAWMEQMLMIELRSGMVFTASWVIDQYARMLDLFQDQIRLKQLQPVHVRIVSEQVWDALT